MILIGNCDGLLVEAAILKVFSKSVRKYKILILSINKGGAVVQS